MTETNPEIKNRESMGCAGIAALLFAASPTIAFVLGSITDYHQRHGKSVGGGQATIGVPPVWVFWLIFVGMSIPWIVAGILLLRYSKLGLWIALVLTIPTALVAVFAIVVSLLAMNAKDSMTSMTTSVSGPFAVSGILFCIVSWATGYDILFVSKRN